MPGIDFNNAQARANAASKEPSPWGAAYDSQSLNRLYGTQYFDSNYQQYMAFIEQYRNNPELYNRLKGLYQFQAYSPSNKESFWGDTSGIQDFYNQLHSSALNGAQQLIDEFSQRSYNDPAKQLERMQMTGVNQDLNGGASLSPGEAGDATPEPAPITPPTHDGSSPAFDFANMGMNFISGLTSLIGGVQALGMNFTQQGLLSVALSSSALDTALKEEAAKWKFPTKEDGTVDYSAVPDLIVPETSIKGRPKGAAGKALERARGNLYDEDGKPTSALLRAIREHQAGAVEAQVRSGIGMSTPGYSESIEEFSAGYSEIIVQKQIDALDWDNKLRKLDSWIRSSQGVSAAAQASVSSGLAFAELQSSQAGVRSAEAGARSAEAIANYNEGYYSSGLGQSKATSEQISADLDALEASIAKEQEETWKAIQDYIKDPKHGRLGKFGITLLPGLRQEVDRIFESRREAISARREALRGIGDAATKGLINSLTP